MLPLKEQTTKTVAVAGEGAGLHLILRFIVRNNRRDSTEEKLVFPTFEERGLTEDLKFQSFSFFRVFFFFIHTPSSTPNSLAFSLCVRPSKRRKLSLSHLKQTWNEYHYNCFYCSPVQKNPQTQHTRNEAGSSSVLQTMKQAF